MKRIFLIIFSLSYALHQVHAQFDIESFKTPAQQMVENAVKPSIVIVKSSFQIRNNKTGMLYGLNGKKVFGEQLSYGIKVQDGIILNDFIVSPWKYNERFLKYKNEYTPVLNAIQYSALGDTARYDSLNVESDGLITLCDSTLFYLGNESCKGVVIDNDYGEKQGWMLWITIPKESDLNKTVDLTIIAQQKSVDITKKKNLFEVQSPKTDYQVIGGLFVTPNYETIGSVCFQLSGILKRYNSKWMLICPFHKLEKVTEIENENNSPEVDVTETQANEELTPVGNKIVSEKKKKAKSKSKNKS